VYQKNIMAENRLIYPVIITEVNDEDGHYFVGEQPDTHALTQGESVADTAFWMEDAIATMLEGEKSYPAAKAIDLSTLEKNQIVVYVSVDMRAWMASTSKTIKKTITVPKYVSDLAKERGINVSKVATEALEELIYG
jgi:post-segregation antitoxin (ccd killing protein)